MGKPRGRRQVPLLPIEVGRNHIRIATTRGQRAGSAIV